MKLTLLALLLLALGCSKQAQPESPGSGALPDTTANPNLMSYEECEAAGGKVVPSLGAAIECPEDTQEIGPVRHGIEGALCCK